MLRPSAHCAPASPHSRSAHLPPEGCRAGQWRRLVMTGCLLLFADREDPKPVHSPERVWRESHSVLHQEHSGKSPFLQTGTFFFFLSRESCFKGQVCNIFTFLKKHSNTHTHFYQYTTVTWTHKLGYLAVGQPGLPQNMCVFYWTQGGTRVKGQ